MRRSNRNRDIRLVIMQTSGRQKYPGRQTQRSKRQKRFPGMTMCAILALALLAAPHAQAQETARKPDIKKADTQKPGTKKTGPTKSASEQDFQQKRQQRRQELETLTTTIRNAKIRQEALEREIAALNKDQAKLRGALIDTARRLKLTESRITAAESKLANLQDNETRLKASLRARRSVLAELLASLQRLGKNPPPALLIRPEDARTAVRSAILLGAVLPELRVEAEALAADLEDLAKIKKRIAAEHAALTAEKNKQQEERHRITRLQKEKLALKQRSEEQLLAEQKKVATLARNAKSLQDLISKIETQITAASQAAQKARLAALNRKKKEAERLAALAEKRKLTKEDLQLSPIDKAKALANTARTQPAIAFAHAHNLLNLPAAGTILRQFGARMPGNETAKGISLATRPQAQITAPADGWVVFAAPFRAYGQLLILNAGDGYRIILAGMERVDVSIGQFILAGEPIAIMGKTRIASAATLDLGSQKPTLYIEFQKDGTPIDPNPWWANPKKGKGSG